MQDPKEPAYITQFEPPGLVVCSRLMEYQWLPERLKLNGAICIEPLNREQVDDYFAAIGTEFKALRSAIQQDTALQELTQSPLMLNIMGMTYQSAGADSFSDAIESVETRRIQIFAAYVDKMFQRKESLGQVFPKDKVINWLSWLAKKMTGQSQSVFFIENMQPSWLDGWKQRMAYRGISSLIFGLIVGGLMGGPIIGSLDMLATGLFVGGLSGSIAGGQMGGLIIGSLETLVSGLVGGLIVWLFAALVIGLSFRLGSAIKNGISCGLTIWLIGGLIGGFNNIFIMGLSIGMLVWLIAGLIASVAINTLNYIKTVETINWSWKSVMDNFSGKIIFRTITILIVGIIIVWFMFMYGLDTTMEFMIFYAMMYLSLLLVPIAGIIIIVIIGGFTNRIKEDKTRPNQGIILSLINGIYTGLIVGFIIGLTVWLTPTVGDGVIAGITGIIIGIIVALNRGLGDAIKHYVLRLVLWRSGNTPRRFIPFLDYCAKLILLKKVGGGYIFIHRMLLDYFAKLGNVDSNPSK